MDTTTLPPPPSARSPRSTASTPTSSSSASAPAGGTAALALATYGVRVHAVTMFPWVANSPRAHITNQRAVEVLRDLGLEEEARKYATPWDQMGDTLFTTSLAGEEIVRLQTWGTGDRRSGDYLQGSPCTMLDIPQPLMEPLLIKNAAERGAILSFNTEYLVARAGRRGRDGAVPRRAHRPRCSSSAPATCWASTAPGPGSPSRSACRSRASSPGPARRTSCSTPT